MRWCILKAGLSWLHAPAKKNVQLVKSTPMPTTARRPLPPCCALQFASASATAVATTADAPSSQSCECCNAKEVDGNSSPSVSNAASACRACVSGQEYRGRDCCGVKGGRWCIRVSARCGWTSSSLPVQSNHATMRTHAHAHTLLCTQAHARQHRPSRGYDRGGGVALFSPDARSRRRIYSPWMACRMSMTHRVQCNCVPSEFAGVI